MARSFLYVQFCRNLYAIKFEKKPEFAYTKINVAGKRKLHRHHCEVGKNRSTVGKIVDSLIFCGLYRLDIRSPGERNDFVNRGDCLDL